MSFIKDFKEFAIKGNAIDMAVGVIIGGAFGKIVSSLVDNVIMPPIGVLTGGVDFTDLKLTIKEAQDGASSNTQLWSVDSRRGRFLDYRNVCVCYGKNLDETYKKKRGGICSCTGTGTDKGRKTAYGNSRYSRREAIDAALLLLNSN